MNKNVIVPSIYHRCVRYPLRGGQGTITANNDPFSSAKSYHAEERFYKIKGKHVVDDEDVLVIVMLRHPLVGFTITVTPLEWGTTETYHHFEVLKKDQTKKSIIFYVLANIDKHVKKREEDGVSTSCNAPDGQYCLQN